jgi:hypothetical protein
VRDLLACERPLDHFDRTLDERGRRQPARQGPGMGEEMALSGRLVAARSAANSARH